MRAVILLGLLVPACFATAQTTSPEVVPDGRIHTQIEGISIPPVANAPFSAKVAVTWDQPLVGGGMVSRKYFTMVARDSQGRVHRETRDFVPADSSVEPRLNSLIITDPVANTRVTCAQEAMNCTVVDFRVALDSVEIDGSVPRHAGGPSRQSLGEQTMNAVPVVGTRETTTSLAGTRGNSRILVSTKDLWYSPDLRMYLSVIRKDPQLGQISLTVTDLSRTEPDPSWFGVPPGYKVVDARSSLSASQ
jgi:hypothetical protein